MSDIANAIMDDLWANGFVPGDKVLQILAKHITPLEQEVERLRADYSACYRILQLYATARCGCIHSVVWDAYYNDEAARAAGVGE